MDTVFQSFNEFFARYAPSDLFGMGLVFSVAMQIPVLFFKLLYKLSDLVRFIVDRCCTGKKSN